MSKIAIPELTVARYHVLSDAVSPVYARVIVAIDWSGEEALVAVQLLLNKGGFQDVLENSAYLLEALPEELRPLPGARSPGSVLRAFLELVFDPPSTASDDVVRSSKLLEVRAAREQLGWTKLSYEQIYKLAAAAPNRTAAVGKMLGPESTDAEREIHKTKMLRQSTVRQILASRELENGGVVAKTVRRRKEVISAALLSAMRDFVFDPEAIDALARKLHVSLSPPAVATFGAASSNSDPVPVYRLRKLGFIALVLLIVGVASVLIYRSDRHGGSAATAHSGSTTNQSSPSATQSISSSPTESISPTETVPVQITDPSREASTTCFGRNIPISGVGSVSTGQHIWAFVYAPGTHLYYPQAVSEQPDGKSWAITGINLGAVGTEDIGSVFTLYALLVDDSTDVRLRGFVALQPDGGYSQEDWDARFKQFVADQESVCRGF